MADSIFINWEQELNKIKTDYGKAMEEIRNLKRELYNLNYGTANKPKGRVIHDDHRLILSAPEIIIGNVNLAGILNPETNSTIIIRGNQVAVEGAGSTGSVKTRAPIIEQKAENPGIDGTEHKIEDLSSITSQACSVTIDSSNVDAEGAFLDPTPAGRGCVSVSSEDKINLSAQKSRRELKTKWEAKKDALGNVVNNEKTQLVERISSFQHKREEIEQLLGEREKIDREEYALRTDYHDLDELNLQIDEKSQEIVNFFFSCVDLGNQLIENQRQMGYFAKKANINVDNKEPTQTAITLSSESLVLNSYDGDEKPCTNKEAGVKISANVVKVDGPIDANGSLEQDSRFVVNTKKVELTTTGKKAVQKDADGTLVSGQFPAEGEVVINSKVINMQSVNTVVKDKKFQETGLAGEGKIIIRAKQIDLSNLNSSDVKVKDDGSIESASYKPEGKINILSGDMTISSMETKFSGDKAEDTNLDANSLIKIRSHKLMFDSTNKDGKLQGIALINAKTIALQANDADPQTGKFKEISSGSKISMYAADIDTFGKQRARFFSNQNVELSGKNALVAGTDTAEIKQTDSNLLTLSGGNAELSGSKNTLKGETTIKVLKSPSITVDNLTANKAIKAPNLSDGIMVDTKDTSTSSSKLKVNEEKGDDLGKDLVNDAGKATQMNQTSANDRLLNQPIDLASDEGLKKDKSEEV